jgi:hypothetical protein
MPSLRRIYFDDEPSEDIEDLQRQLTAAKNKISSLERQLELQVARSSGWEQHAQRLAQSHTQLTDQFNACKSSLTNCNNAYRGLQHEHRQLLEKNTKHANLIRNMVMKYMPACYEPALDSIGVNPWPAPAVPPPNPPTQSPSVVPGHAVLEQTKGAST